VHAPAGIDLGRIDSEEIAAAILAEIIRLKAESGLRGEVAAADEAPPHEEIDPVCGMTVVVVDARFRSVHEERTYYFCSAGCQASFEADPARYVAVPR
jgi:xanthine dehydrogenase accessory factor